MANMKQPKTIEMEIDRLSSLPDTILMDILSLLPIRTAASTSVLSHQWRYLWTHITNVVFTSTCLPSPAILPLLPFPKIDSLNIYLPVNWNDLSDAESWVRDICTRNPEQIVVNRNSKARFQPSIPACIFQCQSLVVLTLINTNIKPPAGEFVATLPNLKKLRIDTGNSDVLNIIFRGCPLLEELNLFSCYFDCLKKDYFFDLSGLTNIKILSIGGWGLFDQLDFLEPEKLVVNVSKLEEITLQAGDLPYVKFVGDFDALIKADITFTWYVINIKREYPIIHKAMEEFVPLISGVTSLEVDYIAIKAFIDLFPIFHKLSDLRIRVNENGSWNYVVRFLQCFPCLEVLRVEVLLSGHPRERYIKLDVPEHWRPCCTPCLSQLRRIDIRNVAGTGADLEMIKYILNCGKVIELLSVHVLLHGRRGEIMKQETLIRQENVLGDKLFHLHNPSACEIRFSGRYVSLSNKKFIPLRRSIRLAPWLNTN